MQKLLVLMLGALCLLCAGCNAGQPVITQVNTIDSLLAGVYDGEVSLAEVRQYGDFGIGTFDRLDGEMLLLDGVFYQIKADGRVYVPGDDMTTPFVSVCRFMPQDGIKVQAQSFEQFRALLDSLATNLNIPVALMLEGEFAFMHTRSVPAQSKPYPPLAEASKHQVEFRMENIRGVVAGFRLPGYFKGINVPGYHLHFVSHDRQQGGHVLDFTLNAGQVRINEIYRFYMLLPETLDDFANADLNRERGHELRAVEAPR